MQQGLDTLQLAPVWPQPPVVPVEPELLLVLVVVVLPLEPPVVVVPVVVVPVVEPDEEPLEPEQAAATRQKARRIGLRMKHLYRKKSRANTRIRGLKQTRVRRTRCATSKGALP